MAVINRRYNYIFLAEPHTGSRAMSFALLTQPDSFKAGQHHATLSDLLERRLVPHRRRNYTTFCVVRNPADILVTRWLQSRLTGTMKFSEYIRQVPWLTFFRHASTVDKVLHWEALPECFGTFLSSIGSPVPDLPVVGVTPGKGDWRSYYNYDTITYLLHTFPEIRQFGYEESLISFQSMVSYTIGEDDV